MTKIAGLAAMILGLVSTHVLATDLDHEIVFHIGAQPLDSALLEFSKQANTPVAFAAKSIGSLKSAGLHGKFPARTALSVLLCNSGLVYTQVGDTVTVVPISAGEHLKPCESPTVASHEN